MTIDQCLIRLNISRKYNDFGLNSYGSYISIFQDFSEVNGLSNFRSELAQWLQRRRCLKMLTDDRPTDGGCIVILIAHLIMDNPSLFYQSEWEIHQ